MRMRTRAVLLSQPEAEALGCAVVAAANDEKELLALPAGSR
jgi:hypothetical protein